MRWPVSIGRSRAKLSILVGFSGMLGPMPTLFAGHRRPFGSALLALLAFCCGWSGEAAAARPRREPPLLFGGGPRKATFKTPRDPGLPTGAAVPAPRHRPLVTAALCSFRLPVCVHATEGVQALALGPALLVFEQAFERTVLALGLPAPLADDGAGGSDALDLYLGGSDSELSVELEPLLLGKLDAAPSFCIAGDAAGSLLERQAALCVGGALATRLDPGEALEQRRALALELWWLTGLPTALDVQAIDDAQLHPEAALTAVGARARGPAAAFSLLLELLETTRSAASPGVLAGSLFSAAASRTPAGAGHFDNEPDVFDVLRHSLDEEPARMADLLVDFSLRRALAGDRDDGTRLPSLAFAGAFARPHFDWVIPFSSLPRRVLSGRPIAPTGAELIWIELDEAPFGAALGFRAEWEAPVTFQWRLLLVDREGREVRRMDVPFQERATSVDTRVLRLDGAKALIIAGVNLGGVELAHPFDPDVTPFEPSACTVYLVRL